MRRKFWTILALALVVPGLMMLAGCPPKDVPGPEVPYQGQPDPERTQPTPTPIPGDPDGPGPDGPDGPGPDKFGVYDNPTDDPESVPFVNKDIHFEFDSSALSSEAQGILKDKANFMNKYKNSSVTVEGHCDERGTNEYNLALGDRRAESVKSFLLKLGISASRMKTISYGEERPLDPGHDEDAWAKNRRAHFLLQK